MRIAKKAQTKKVRVGDTMTAFEYPRLDSRLHGSVVELTGRYPQQGRVMNEQCAELAYVIEGSGTLVVEGEKVPFAAGDQLFIAPGERYYWEATATLFLPCAPAWYSEQHKDIE